MRSRSPAARRYRKPGRASRRKIRKTAAKMMSVTARRFDRALVVRLPLLSSEFKDRTQVCRFLGDSASLGMRRARRVILRGNNGGQANERRMGRCYCIEFLLNHLTIAFSLDLIP